MLKSFNQISSESDIRLLSKNKAASFLGIGKKKLDKLINEGKIRFIELSGKKVFPLKSLNDFIENSLKTVNFITAEQNNSLTKFELQGGNNSQKDIINYNSIISRIILEKKNGFNHSAQ